MKYNSFLGRRFGKRGTAEGEGSTDSRQAKCLGDRASIRVLERDRTRRLFIKGVGSCDYES